MSEDEELKNDVPEENPDLDDALKTLLGDLEKQADPPLPAAVPRAEAVAPPTAEPEREPAGIPEAAFEDFLSAVQTEYPVDPDWPVDEDVAPPVDETPVPVEESAVSATPRRPRYRPVETVRRKRRWPWVVFVILIGLGSSAYMTRAHWKTKVLAHFGIRTLPAVDSVPAGLNMALPPMDADFLPPQVDSAAVDSGAEPTAEPAANPTPPATSPKPTPAETHVPASAATEHVKAPPLPAPAVPNAYAPVGYAPVVRAMDSAVIADLSGNLKDRKVRFHCNLVLFSSSEGLERKLPDFEEALRAVTANIFYFTVPGKTNLPDIERQVLLKAGFVFPDGKLIRVEVRHLEMESVAP